MIRRKPTCQSLETRTLLAGDVCEAFPVAETAEPDSVLLSADNVLAADSVAEPEYAVSPAIGLPHFPFWKLQPGLLVDAGDQVFAVREHFVSERELAPESQTLFIFDRLADGSLEQSASIPLDFRPLELRVSQNHLLVVGHGHWAAERLGEPPTSLMTIARSDASTTSTYESAGHFVSLALEGDQAYLTTQEPRYYIQGGAFAPPIQDDYQLMVIDLAGDTTSKVATGHIHTPVTENSFIDGGLALIEASRIIDGTPIDGTPIDLGNQSGAGDRHVTRVEGSLVRPTIAPNRIENHLVRYVIDGDEVVATEKLELEQDMYLELTISDDRQTAVAVGRGNYNSDVGHLIHLLDLSGEQFQLFDSIEVSADQFWSPSAVGEHYVVVAEKSALLVVNIDQSIDIDSASRVTRVGYPNPDVDARVSGVMASPTAAGSFYLIRQRARYGWLPANDSPELIVSVPDTELLTFSAGDMAFRGRSEFEGISSGSLELIDASLQRYGFRSHPSNFGTHFHSEYVFGTFDDEGSFTEEGRIDLTSALEAEATTDHLIVRGIDHLLIYRWNDLESPQKVPLGEAFAGIEAVDDEFIVNTAAGLEILDVLANDQVINIPISHARPRIVDLIDAPDGVEIGFGGHDILLTQEAVQSPEAFRFQYVLAYGNETSTATVEVSKVTYTEQDVKTTIDSVINRLAGELNVDPSGIRVVTQSAFVSHTMPQYTAAGIANPLGGDYGVTVDLIADDYVYSFVANFDGKIERIAQQEFKILMDIQMRAVDAAGNELRSVSPGDEFFIEVTTQDRRSFAKGVFAFSFDLVVPPELLELTGDIETLGRFEKNAGRIVENEIDDYHAIDVRFKPPGPDPQTALLIGVRAVAAGSVTLQTDPAESIGAELLLHGVDTVIPPSQVEYGSLGIDIVAPLLDQDADGNGEVTPSDALRVINFLGRHGTRSVNELPTIAGIEAEATSEMQSMRRLDTNGDGDISARDALNIINHLARSNNAKVESEFIEDDSLETDDVRDDVERGLF